MKRHLSDSEPDLIDCDDYEECSSPDTAQVISRKKRRGIIEKRRRDRINNCLLELRRLVPAAFEKQGSAKLEKAEILQMTVDHLRHLHQCRDSRGFSDPFGPYGNTRAFLDYRIMGFRECVAETARYMTSVEGVDMKDPLRVRVLNHLESYLAQRELAINAAVVANSQMSTMAPKGMMAGPCVGPIVPVTQTTIKLPSPHTPLTPPRGSPDSLSPPASLSLSADTAAGLPPPRFSLAAYHPAPIISFAPTANIPVFRAAPSSVAGAGGVAGGGGGGFAAVRPTVVRPSSIAVGGGPTPPPPPPHPPKGTTITTATTMGEVKQLLEQQPLLLSPVSPPTKHVLNISGTAAIMSSGPIGNGNVAMTTNTNTTTTTPPPSTVNKTPFRPWMNVTDTTKNSTSTVA